MERKINLDDWFNREKEEITAGVELELMLFDLNKKEPLQDMGLVEHVLRNLPYNIYRDYYPYQLEIRTKPSPNPDEIIKETLELYKLASEEFTKKDVLLVPVPNISDDNDVPCGMHMHINYKNKKTGPTYFNKAMGMYPFLLSLADHTKNFELSELNTSGRMVSSRHIGLPYLNKDQFIKNTGGDYKHRDLILSRPVDDEEDRHRLVKPITLEVRLIDTPSLLSYYKYIIETVMALASHIKTKNPMIEMLNNDRLVNYLGMTRRLMVNQRYGINKIFHMWNADVCEDIAKRFGIIFPRETQFEYRERLGIAANVNGYLSMAIDGGWL